MIVQHNITAMNSNRMLGLTTSAQAKSTERLSSGYKINRAADDAAGLTISEKMRRQIRGLTQASLNAQDGISCVQTAEGALTEVHDMLQRMDELATKAANGTMTTEDRQAVQAEINQLITEIDRVSETTKFNELDLLKGKKVAASPQIVVYKKGIDPEKKSVEKKAAYTTPTWYLKGSKTAMTDDEIMSSLEVKADGTIGFKDGVDVYTTAAVDTEFGAQAFTNLVAQTAIDNLFQQGTDALYKDQACTQVATADELAGFFEEDGTYKGGLYKKNAAGAGTAVQADWIDKYVDITAATEASVEPMKFKLHVGSESDEENKITVSIKAMSASGIGIAGLSDKGVMTQDDATNAIDTIKSAISQVSEQRSALGAVQNRLEHTINNLDNIVENTTSAEAQIRDTDIATEMVKYANNNILQQAGTSMLSQANQANSLALSLLG